MKKLLFLATLLAAAAGVIGAQEKSALETDPSGWTDLLPDANFTGWTRISFTPTDPLKEPSQWKVDLENRAVLCSGKGGHEWLQYEKPMDNFIYHVEWRFNPSSPEDKKYNGGLGARLSKYGEIWFQAQTTPEGGYLFGNNLVDGKLQRFNLRNQMTSNRVKPPGEWNTFEIRAEGDTMTLWVNGGVVNTLKGVALREGYIALEAEYFDITYRNIKVKMLP